MRTVVTLTAVCAASLAGASSKRSHNAPAFGRRGIPWRGVARRSNTAVFSLLAPSATGGAAPSVLRRVYEMSVACLWRVGGTLA